MENLEFRLNRGGRTLRSTFNSDARSIGPTMRTDAGHADVNDVTPDPGIPIALYPPGAFQVDSGKVATGPGCFPSPRLSTDLFNTLSFIALLSTYVRYLSAIIVLPSFFFLSCDSTWFALLDFAIPNLFNVKGKTGSYENLVVAKNRAQKLK